MEKTEQAKTKFSIKTLVDDGTELYTDTIDTKQRINQSSSYSSAAWDDQAAVLSKIDNADSSANEVLKKSRKLYATNPIYRKIIGYYSTMFLPRYIVTPRLSYTKDDKLKKLTGKNWNLLYNHALELVDGLNLSVKMPQLLAQLYTEGGVFFTIMYDAELDSLDTIILPITYCQRIGETSFGSDVIQFDFSFFDSLGFNKEQLKELMASFPDEFNKYYNAYKKDSSQKWHRLDPRFSSCVLMNQKAIPTLLYSYMNILNYEAYTANEVTRSTEALQTIVVHHIPTWQDKLLLETTEMNLLHKKLSAIVRTAKNTRLVTTIGEVEVKPLLTDSSTVADNTLENAYKSIYDAAGLNNGMFYGNNQYSIAASQSIDKGIVWQDIEKIINFYNVAINNCEIDLQGYQVEITMLPISRDHTNDDIAVYRENAKVGVDILQFIVASGIKQKDVDSYLDMETNLKLLSRVTPLRSANTMSDNPTPSIPASTEMKVTEDKEKDSAEADE